MIFTSNYARQHNNPLAIGISCTLTDWFKHVQHLPELGPTWDMVDSIKDGKMTQDEYTERYLQLLVDRKINPELFGDMEDGTMLLCYEKPGDFCHRRLLAEWVEEETGLVIPEWKNDKELHKFKQNEFADSVLEF